MRAKKYILPLLMSIFMLMMVGLVYAASCATTCTGTKTTSLINLTCNATLSGITDTTDFNATNGTLYLYSADRSQNTSTTTRVAFDYTNESWTNSTHGGEGLTFNISYLADGGLVDGNDYKAYITLVNTTATADILTCSATTGITVDYSKPKCVFDSALTSSDIYKPSQTWSLNCGNATSATLQFGSNDLKTMSESVWSGFGKKTCTYTGDQKAVPEGSYKTLTAKTSDGTNTTTCTLTSIRIDEGVPLKQVAIAVASGQKGQAGTSFGNNNLLIILIIGLAAFWYVRRKK